MGWSKGIYIIQTNMFYTVTEKYPLEDVFVYNFISPNVNLFLLQAYYIFMWICLSVCSKYGVNFVF